MRHLTGCEAGNFGGCTCGDIRAAKMAKINAAKEIRREMAAAIFGAMYGAENWNDTLYIHAQDLAYIAADRALAISRPPVGDAT